MKMARERSLSVTPYPPLFPLRSAGQQQIPANETLIRFPKRLMHMFPELSSGR